MDVWQLILYGFGAFLALRMFAALMHQHRNRYLQQLVAKHRLEQARQQRDELQAAEAADREAADNTTDDAAA